MIARLRELAEGRKGGTASHDYEMGRQECADELLSILDTEGDGGVAEDVERNAARYRFIRDEQATIIYKRKQDGEWEPLVDTYSTSTRCASLDTAIDTAMLATAPSPGESA